MIKWISCAALLLCSTGALANDKLTVLLDWFINPDHAQLIVAQELGLFEKAGLDVEMIEPADPSLPPKMVAAKKADIAISYQPQLHVQVAEGLPLTRFGTLVSTPLNSLVVLQDGPIKSLADLKGKKVGFSVGGFEDALLKTMLQTEGLDLDDVELVNVNFSLSPSLLTGAVDAVIGAYRNFELNQMDIENHPGTAFYPEEHGVPLFDELILVTHTSRVDDPLLATFMSVIQEATTYLINHPDDAWELFKQSNPDTLDNELNKRAWADTLRRFALRPAALDKQRYETFAEYMLAAGLLESTPSVDTYTAVVQ